MRTELAGRNGALEDFEWGKATLSQEIRRLTAGPAEMQRYHAKIVGEKDATIPQLKRAVGRKR
jgi:hypothetical protein